MNTKDIEEIVEEFFNKFYPDLSAKVHGEQTSWLRTTLTKHHEAEVEKAYERGYKKGKCDKEIEIKYGKDFGEADIKDVAKFLKDKGYDHLAKVLTPTTPDKQTEV